jgi:DNA-binding response OmpR family regulator
MSKPQKQHCIFVVDDEPVIASTLGLILSHEGFDVRPFTDPLEALQALQEKAPDLVIADVVMPGLSGIELAITLRETSPGCAVLLFSGAVATGGMLESARGRGYDFEVLPKPIHPINLVARVRSGLGLNSPVEGLTAGLVADGR